jgi:hypothetical protein
MRAMLEWRAGVRDVVRMAPPPPNLPLLGGGTHRAWLDSGEPQNQLLPLRGGGWVGVLSP